MYAKHGFLYMASCVLAALILISGSAQAQAEDQFDLNNYSGKIVYVDFWASWCGPCRASFPFMRSLVEEFGDDLAVVAINLDANRSDATKFLAEFDVNFDIIYDPKGGHAGEYGLRAMPSSYLHDRDGVLLGSHVGFRNKDAEDIRQAIKDAVEQ